MAEKWDLKILAKKIISLAKKRDLPLEKEFIINSLSKKNHTVQMVTNSLDCFSCSLSTEGAARILEGDLSGWQTMRRGWQFRAFQAFANISWFDRALAETGGVYKPRKTMAVPLTWTEISYAALALAEAAIYGERRYIHWLTERMEKNLTEKDPLIESATWDWPYAHVEPFLFLLFSRWRGNIIKIHPGIQLKLDVYKEIFEAWEYRNRLEKAIVRICDYHCNNVKNDFHSFSHTFAFMVYPVEVLALYWVRREMNLDTPLVKHPLLDNPLFAAPKSIPLIEPDSELLQVVRRCQELMDLKEIPIDGFSPVSSLKVKT